MDCQISMRGGINNWIHRSYCIKNITGTVSITILIQQDYPPQRLMQFPVTGDSIFANNSPPVYFHYRCAWLGAHQACNIYRGGARDIDVLMGMVPLKILYTTLVQFALLLRFFVILASAGSFKGRTNRLGTPCTSSNRFGKSFVSPSKNIRTSNVSLVSRVTAHGSHEHPSGATISVGWQSATSCVQVAIFKSRRLHS